MKSIFRILFFIAATTLSCDITAQTMEYEVTVENRQEKERKDVAVVIDLKELGEKEGNRWIGGASVTCTNDKKRIAWQLDDIDGDSYPDELAFVTDLGAKEKKSFTVKVKKDKDNAEFAIRTYADMMLEDKKGKHPLINSLEAPGDSYLYNDLYHHGAAWESELVGYRVYFDERQNIDIYGKKLKRLELKETHFYTTPEQMKQDYGNDVLWAGSSIGCGSFKGFDGKTTQNISPVRSRGQKVVASGPIRTIVEVTDKGWDYQNSQLNMRQLYILYAGHRDTEVRISFDQPLKNETFCTGVQKYGTNSTSFVLGDGLAATWGSDYPEAGKKEQFPPEFVGLGVYVPKEFVKKYVEDDLNHLFVLGAKNKKEIIYYLTFGADKEQEGCHSSKTWFAKMNIWKEDLENCPKITIKKIKETR